MNLIKIFSDFRQKRFEKECRNRFLHLQKTFRRNRFFIFFWFCYIFGFWAKVLKEIAWNFPQSCQNSFLRVQTKTLMKKEDFWKLFFCSKFEQFFSWLLAKIILQNWQNCFLSDLTNTLMYSQHLLWKVLPLFLDFGRNFFWIFEFFFFAKCENCFLRIDTNTSIEKIFFEKFSSFFGIGSKHFLIFGQKSTERLSELLSTCSKTCWRNRIFHFHSLLVVLSDFGQNFSDNWLKIFHKAVKTAFYVIRRTLWWKEMILETCFFSKFEQIYSWLLRKINLQSWQNCFLSIRTNTLVYNQQLHWKILLLLLAFGRIYLWVFEFFFFAKLWKLFPKKGDEHFDQKHFFLETSPQSFSESDRNIF